MLYQASGRRLSTRTYSRRSSRCRSSSRRYSTDRLITIPKEEVRSVYRQWRPSPLYRARRLEKALETPARIYYKYEGVSPAGSHNPNTAVAQAYYNARRRHEAHHRDRRRPVGLVARIRRRALRHRRADLHGARVVRPEAVPPRADGDLRRAVHPSPSDETKSGKAILEKNPKHPGSLGIAISEAVEVAAQREDTKYSLGSVLNHVLLHQTVVGQEARRRWRGRRLPGRDRRLHRRRVELRRHRVSVPRGAAPREARSASSRSSRRPARVSRAASTHTTSATPRTSRRS